MQIRPNAIVALCIISESELVKVMPDYTYDFEYEYPEEFNKLMHELGADLRGPYYRQDAIQHRNRFGEIVTCSRWVFEERLDKAWINSGYASREAIDKASGSKLVESIYRQRGLTQDMQDKMADRDKYFVEDDE